MFLDNTLLYGNRCTHALSSACNISSKLSPADLLDYFSDAFQFRRRAFSLLVSLTFCFLPCTLADHYVAQNGQAPSGTFTSWETAASNIQDALNVSYTNSTVWVGAGRYTASTSSVDYAGTNVVYINRALTLRSSNGVPASTIIDGQGSNRGIAIVYGGSTTNLFVVNGFTISNCSVSTASALTDGRCYGGGILFKPTAINITWTGTVQNCVICNNTIGPASGYDFGAGIYGGYTTSGRYFLLVTNCTIRGNRNYTGWGGGIYASAAGGSMVHSCLVESNSAISGGGGLGVATYVNCVFGGNSATGTASNTGGGGVYNGYATFTNCLMYNNTAGHSGGFAFSWDNKGPFYFYNCTVVSNSAPYGGAIKLDGPDTKITLVNSIVYSNSATEFSVLTAYATNSCFRTNGIVNPIVVAGNITNPPAFVDFAGQNFRLSRASPCVNTGTNQDWMTNSVDLDGKMRVRYGRVDMGAYELIHDGTIYRFH